MDDSTAGCQRSYGDVGHGPEPEPDGAVEPSAADTGTADDAAQGRGARAGANPRRWAKTSPLAKATR